MENRFSSGLSPLPRANPLSLSFVVRQAKAEQLLSKRDLPAPFCRFTAYLNCSSFSLPLSRRCDFLQDSSSGVCIYACKRLIFVPMNLGNASTMRRLARNLKRRREKEASGTFASFSFCFVDEDRRNKTNRGKK